MGPGQTPQFHRRELERSIVARFQHIADRFAERPAVTCEGRVITYAALNAAANRIAHALLSAHGNTPQPVGLLLDHTEHAVAVLLGVLKAGMFYVPLDPSYPAERLMSIVGACRPVTMIADQAHMDLARELAPDCTVVTVPDLYQAGREDNPEANLSPDDLAAVFFTSGSTDRPKGVMQSHRSILHRVMVDTNGLHITSDDRTSLLTSASYSWSVRQLFVALLNGAALCFFNIVKAGLVSLPHWLQEQEVTVYASVPAVFRQLTARLTGRENFEALRLVVVGGEPVTLADFALYRKFFPANCQFVVSLASNETGIMRMLIANHSTDFADGVVPVGYPVEDKHVAIHDDNGRELPANQVGEIVVRSEFLAPGYWNQPELTAATFLPDPAHPGSRVYRTGDLGEMSAAGCLIFRGRKDLRIKVRGVRVEPEEVEAALHLHPDVAHAAVAGSDSSTTSSRLTAYVVRRQGSAMTVSELRRFVAVRLPPALVPSAFVYVDALPQTPNGKVDRTRLPRPAATRPELDVPFEDPSNPIERSLVQLCEMTLKIPSIGRRDNLFDLGVDSLTLVLLTARIEEEFNTRLAPATLLTNPTVAHLAELLARNDVRHTWSSLLPIQTEGTMPPFFLIHGDGSTIFLSRYLGLDWPIYGLEHQSQDGLPAEYRTLRDIAAYYLREIRKVRSSGPYFLGGYSFGGIVALEVAQTLRRDGHEVKLLALLDPPSLINNVDARSALRPRLLPLNVTSLRDEFRRHRDRVEGFSVRQLVAYLWPRLTDRVEDVLRISLIVRAWQTLIYKSHLALGRRLPVHVRPRYIQDLYLNARDGYEAQPYDGRVILFKTPDRKYVAESDWEDILTGEIDVHVVDATHTEIREEAFVPLWAERLKTALSICF
jgi:amino acid adenylation domain-containing protein